jgi:hypothetical protein
MRLRVAERILEFTTQIRNLKELIPICMYCKRVRDDSDYWQQVESYIQTQTGSSFSHGICPECFSNICLLFQSGRLSPRRRLHKRGLSQSVGRASTAVTSWFEPKIGQRKNAPMPGIHYPWMMSWISSGEARRDDLDDIPFEKLGHGKAMGGSQHEVVDTQRGRQIEDRARPDRC